MYKAQLYSTSNALQRRDATAALARYRNTMSWSEDCNVMDIGCGTGDVTRCLLMPALRRLSKVVAVDISPAMVTFAASRHQHPRLQFRCMDIAKVSRPRELFPQGFHKIFSFYCLHWVNEQSRALNNIFELLLPGGEVLLVYLASNPLMDVYERLAANSPWSQYMQDASRFVSVYQHSEHPAKELRAHMERAGFSVVECECLDETFAYPSRAALTDSVKSVNPFMDRIPKDLRDDYIQECVTRLESYGEELEDGSVTLSYRLFVVFARKPFLIPTNSP